MSQPVISFDRVCKSFSQYNHVTAGIKSFLFHLPTAIRSLRQAKYTALKDITFDVQKGEVLGIIGKNGAGKSTTLGLVAGVLKPTSGRVFVKGRVSPMLELGAGFHRELTGRENIFLKGVLMGLTRAEVAQRLDEIIEFSELGDFIDQPIRTYSSGMLTRLGFSVVSSLDPEILLIDEILAVGDMDFQKKCVARMLEFKSSAVTMLFVSHAMKQVGQICDRVIWIENHEIKQMGPPEAVTTAYTQGSEQPHSP